MTDDNLLKILIIVATIYLLYICSIQMTWCIRKFLQRFNAVLPILKETHKYRITFFPTLWHHLEIGSDIYFSIQGEKGVSKFFSLPRKQFADLTNSFSFYTPGCLQELYSIIIHVQGSRPHLWRINFVQIMDIPHATQFTFPFYCDLNLTSKPKMYMSTVQAKFYPHCILFGKRTFFDYHNFTSPFSNSAVASFVWPIAPLTFIFSQVLNSLFFGVMAVFLHKLNLGNVLLLLVFFLYLLVKVFLPDLIFQFSEKRGRRNRVWRRRKLAMQNPDHFSADSDDEIKERKVTAEREILKALEQHPLVAAAREKQRVNTKPFQILPETKVDSLEEIEDIGSIGSLESFSESLTPSPTSFTVKNTENPTLFKVLFYPFNIKQLFENRVHLWTLFFELWHMLEIKAVECYSVLIPTVGMLQKLSFVMDVNLFQQELTKLLTIVTEFQSSVRKSTLINENDVSEKLSSIEDISNEHSGLIQLLEVEILTLTCIVINDLSMQRIGPVSFQSHHFMEEYLSELIKNLFNLKYLIRSSEYTSHKKIHAFLPIDIGNTLDLSKPFFASDLSVQTLTLVEDATILSDEAFNLDQIIENDREDIMQVWYHWIPSFVNCILNYLSQLHEEKFLNLCALHAIIFIQVQEDTRTWEESCCLYVETLAWVIKNALLKYLCLSLHKDTSSSLSLILAENLKSRIAVAVDFALNSLRNILMPEDDVTEALAGALRKALNPLDPEAGEGLSTRVLYFKQIKLLYLLNGLLRPGDIQNSGRLTSRMNAILLSYPEKIKYLKSVVPMLLEEFQSVEIMQSSVSNVEVFDDVLSYSAKAVSVLRETEKALAATELCLDAIHLDIPFAALDFNADEINLHRVHEVLQSYFGDKRQLSMTSTGTSVKSSRRELPFPSVVTLEAFTQIDPNTALMLRKPWLPSLPFYCGWIMMIIVGCDIAITSIAIIVYGNNLTNSELERALLVMFVGILLDVFILQPIKCIFIVILSNCIYRKGVFEMFEINQNLVQ